MATTSVAPVESPAPPARRRPRAARARRRSGVGHPVSEPESAARRRPAGRSPRAREAGACGPEMGRYPGAFVPVSLPLGTPVTELPGAPAVLPSHHTRGHAGARLPGRAAAAAPRRARRNLLLPKEDERRRSASAWKRSRPRARCPRNVSSTWASRSSIPAPTRTTARSCAKVGLSPELRRSEARFVSFHLKKTLESTGNWGAVRVVPGPGGEGLDLTVTGRIRESNGKRLTLDVVALDARAGSGSQALPRRGRYLRLSQRARRPRRRPSRRSTTASRTTSCTPATNATRRSSRPSAGSPCCASPPSSLPEAFSPYLKSNRSGRFTLVRAPADGRSHGAANREHPRARPDVRGHPERALPRLLRAHERPLRELEDYTYDEQDALDHIPRESLSKKILGGAAILVGMS